MSDSTLDTVTPSGPPVIRSAFVTGASGFIGGALMARLRSRGATVRGLDRRAGRMPEILAGDVAEAGDWQAAVAGAEVVIHTAAMVSNTANLAAAWRLNVLGTRRALDAAVTAGARRFVHLSSVRAFSDLGFPDGVDERWPVRPDGNPYVDTKVASEQVVLQAHAAGEIDCTIIRPADVYGPGSRPWTILPVEAIRGGRFLLPAHGRGVFSPVYIENLLDGILLAAEHPAAAGQVFTIGDGNAVSCREFFGYYCRMLGVSGPRCVGTPVAVGLARVNAAAFRLRGISTEANPATVRYLTRRGTYSIAKAAERLGYVAKVSLEQGMSRTEAWLQETGVLAVKA